MVYADSALRDAEILMLGFVLLLLSSLNRKKSKKRIWDRTVECLANKTPTAALTTFIAILLLILLSDNTARTKKLIVKDLMDSIVDDVTLS